MTRQEFIYKETKVRSPEGRHAIGSINYIIHAKELEVPSSVEFYLTPEGEIYLTVSPPNEQHYEVDLVIPQRRVNKDALESLTEGNTIIEVEFPDEYYKQKHNKVDFFEGKGFPNLPDCFTEVIAKYKDGDKILYNGKSNNIK